MQLRVTDIPVLLLLLTATVLEGQVVQKPAVEMENLGCYPLVRDYGDNSSVADWLPLYKHWLTSKVLVTRPSDIPPACARFCAAKGLRLSGTTRDGLCACYQSVQWILTPRYCDWCDRDTHVYVCSTSSDFLSIYLYNSSLLQESQQAPRRCFYKEWADRLPDGRRLMPWIMGSEILADSDDLPEDRIMHVSTASRTLGFEKSDAEVCRRKCQMLRQCWGFVSMKEDGTAWSPDSYTGHCILLDQSAMQQVTLRPSASDSGAYAIAYRTWRCNGSGYGATSVGMQHLGCGLLVGDDDANSSMATSLPLYQHRLMQNLVSSASDIPPACARFCAAKGFRLSGSGQDGGCACYQSIEHLVLIPRYCEPCDGYTCSISSDVPSVYMYNSSLVQESRQVPRRCSHGEWTDRLSGGGRITPRIKGSEIHAATQDLRDQAIMSMSTAARTIGFENADAVVCGRRCQRLNHCWGFVYMRVDGPNSVAHKYTGHCILLDKFALQLVTVRPSAADSRAHAVAYRTWRCSGSGDAATGLGMQHLGCRAPDWERDASTYMTASLPLYPHMLDRSFLLSPTADIPPTCARFCADKGFRLSGSGHDGGCACYESIEHLKLMPRYCRSCGGYICSIDSEVHSVYNSTLVQESQQVPRRCSPKEWTDRLSGGSRLTLWLMGSEIHVSDDNLMSERMAHFVDDRTLGFENASAVVCGRRCQLLRHCWGFVYMMVDRSASTTDNMYAGHCILLGKSGMQQVTVRPTCTADSRAYAFAYRTWRCNSSGDEAERLGMQHLGCFTVELAGEGNGSMAASLPLYQHLLKDNWYIRSDIPPTCARFCADKGFRLSGTTQDGHCACYESIEHLKGMSRYCQSCDGYICSIDSRAYSVYNSTLVQESQQVPRRCSHGEWTDRLSGDRRFMLWFMQSKIYVTDKSRIKKHIMRHFIYDRTHGFKNASAVVCSRRCQRLRHCWGYVYMKADNLFYEIGSTQSRHCILLDKSALQQVTVGVASDIEAYAIAYRGWRCNGSGDETTHLGMQHLGCRALLWDEGTYTSKAASLPLYQHRLTDNWYIRSDIPPTCARFCADKGFRLSGSTEDDRCACYESIEHLKLMPRYCQSCDGYICSNDSDVYSVYNSTLVQESQQVPRRGSHGYWTDRLSEGRKLMPWFTGSAIHVANRSKKFMRRFQHFRTLGFERANAIVCSRRCQRLRHCWGFVYVTAGTPAWARGLYRGHCILLDKSAMQQVTVRPTAADSHAYAIAYRTWRCSGCWNDTDAATVTP